METIRLSRTGVELANRRVILLSRGVSYVLTELASIMRATSLLSNGLRWAGSPNCAKLLDQEPSEPRTCPTRSEMARGGATLLEILLVVLFSAVEFACWCDLRRNGPAKLSACLQRRA